MKLENSRDVAARLVALRREAGLSQEDLAERLGLSRQAISKWERAESQPDMGNLIALADVYGLTIDELVRPKGDDPNSDEPQSDASQISLETESGGIEDDAFAEEASANVEGSADAQEESSDAESNAESSVHAEEGSGSFPPPVGAPVDFDIGTAPPPVEPQGKKSRKKLMVILIVIAALAICAWVVVSAVRGCMFVASPPSAPSAPSAPNAPNVPSAPSVATSDVVDANGYVESSAYEISLDDIDGIDIDWAAGSVTARVVPDADTEGMVKATESTRGNVPRDQLMSCGVVDRHLSINYQNSGSLLFFGCASMGSKHLDLQIPESASGRLDWFSLDAASGTYTLSDLEAKSIVVNMASGNMEASGLRSEQVKLDVASGFLRVGGTFSTAAKTEIASGNVELRCEGDAPQKIDASLASGGLLLELPEDSGFSAAVEKLSGTFNCEFDADVRGETYTFGDGACVIDVEMTSGSATLRPADMGA